MKKLSKILIATLAATGLVLLTDKSSEYKHKDILLNGKCKLFYILI